MALTGSQTESTRICSKHFVNGEKSTIESHPGYNPTLFPDVYKVRHVDGTKLLSRYERWRERRTKVSLAPSSCSETADSAEEGAQSTLLNEDPISQEGELVEPLPSNLDILCMAIDAVKETKEDKDCQTDGVDATGTGAFSVFLCCVQGNEACSQINHKCSRDDETQCRLSTVSRHCGTDYRMGCFNGYDTVKDNGTALKDLCGVSDVVFSLFLSILPQCAERRCDISMRDRLLIFFMKLKLGISYSALAVLFSTSRNTVSRHFNSVLRTVAAATHKWVYLPPRQVIKRTMPGCFKVHYPDCTMIIDCTEVRTEQPCTIIQQQRLLYSHYKGGYTLKFLVAITPCGAVCFRSKSYGGRFSDAFITVDSGFLNLVQPGDVVMADKGFPGIRAGLEGTQAVLVMPPFLQGGGQFSESDVHETYKIAQVRIHVERAIQRIKMFNILNVRVPTELIPAMSDVFHVCCILANLQPPIIQEQLGSAHLEQH
ncbi:uncharacterized protein LOC119452548 [Dermacentor silvarum]|uniref:uncharacterized protein LOC119452548 n=1 Tax=Dermacentor silvarum TaxID=543639 RepID=UPI002100F876|nr:uncharacterized protein LOC119452548 [Dermacentor silvarum]